MASCDNCRFVRGREMFVLKSDQGDVTVRQGWCHAEPPKALSGTFSSFPTVSLDKWCARHRWSFAGILRLFFPSLTKEKMMTLLEKQIESTFTDPHGGQAETDKHLAAATQVLGANPILLNSQTSGVLDEKGQETVGFKLTTRWRQRPPGA